MQSDEGVDLAQLFIGRPSRIAPVAYEMAHQRPVLLFYARLVIPLVGPRTCEEDTMASAIVVQGVVDELAAVVAGEAAQQSERHLAPHPIDAAAHSTLSFAPYWDALRPTGGDRRHPDQGGKIETFYGHAEVKDQVHLQVAGFHAS